MKKHLSIVQRHAQQGFSLVTAIFLLVVLSALGAMMVTFFAVQQQSSALDTMGSRAYQAARAGVEWGAYEVMRNPAGSFTTSCQAPGGTTQVLPALANTLAPFTVTITCSAKNYSDPASLWIYSIGSDAKTTGSVAGSTDYVERQLQAVIAQ